MFMSLFTTSVFAQEKVRGIETRLVKTEEIVDNNMYLYAVEFTNRNSIPVSITMELWRKGSWSSYYERYGEDKIELTKDVVLKPGESYTWKIRKKKGDDGTLYSGMSMSYTEYYYKYEAYKLQ